MKPCCKCGQYFPLDLYAKRKDRPDGRGSICKACKADYDAEYRARQREKINANHRRWWATHPDKAEGIRQRRKAARIAWYLRTRETRNAESRRYQQEHRAEIRRRKRAYRRARPEIDRENHRRRKVRQRAARLSGYHTLAQWRACLAFYGHRCASCGATGTLTRDHIIPLSRGGSDRIENIQPLCPSCNSRKGAKLIAPGSKPGAKGPQRTGAGSRQCSLLDLLTP